MIMNSFILSELAIVIVAKNHNPTILNPDFLKYNSIVPEEWSLQGKPLCIEPMAQVSYDNGIKITSQVDKIVFYEKNSEQKNSNFLIPEIASKYVNILPHVEYSAIGINPRGHIQIDEAPRYLIDKFIKHGPWSSFGNDIPELNIKFNYQFDRYMLALTIELFRLKTSDNQNPPVISFAANNHFTLNGEDRNQRLNNLSEIIPNWQTVIQDYHEMVNKILNEDK